MKVLVCIPCLLNGGTEIQTLSLVEALVAAGHEPTVVCYFEYDPKIVERYCHAGAHVELMSADGIRPTNIRKALRHIWNGMRRIVKSCHPDVAHVQYMAPGAIPVIVLKMLGVKKIIATTHTPADIYGNNGRRLIRWLSKTCIDAFQCITLLAERSYFDSATLFDNTLRRHFTIYNALPSHIAVTDRLRNFDKNEITIGVVSRLAPIKGMDLVIPSFDIARMANRRLRLLIVGDGELRQLMERQASDSTYASDIMFAGLKPQNELQEWYDRIDILLMPSRSEGFGLTAIEGMARGCVPIVAKTGGLPEVVTPDCGLLHDCEDVNDISRQILNCIPQLRERSIASVNRACMFSSSQYYDSIKKLYSII